MTGFRRIILLLVRLYQLCVSPHFPPCCRYVPSCSAYAYEAIEKYGPLKGLFLAGKRILRCHPFHSGGYDPVPENYSLRENFSPALIIKRKGI